MTRSIRSFRIHGPSGILERVVEGISRRVRGKGTRTIADTVPIVEIMSRDVVCAVADLDLSTLVALMVSERLGCVPIVDESIHPVGMVTKLDIVEQLVNPLRQPSPRVADVMMPIAITLDEATTVAHAVALMASEDMHHVMIVSGRKLVGVVSTMDVTRWLADNDGMPA